MKQDRNGVRTPQDIERKYNITKLNRDVTVTKKSAENAQKIADEVLETTENCFEFIEDEGLTVGNKKNGIWKGFRARMTGREFEIVNSLGSVVARYGENLIELGLNAKNAVISFCKGKGKISYSMDGVEGKEYLDLQGEENTRVKGEKESALWASDKENGIGGKAVVKTYVDEENADYVATMYANDGESLEDDGDGYFGSFIKAMLKNGILMRTYSNIMAIARSTIELISKNSYIVLSALSGGIYLETGDKVYINEKPICDFVVEEGAIEEWTYRKWNSGIAECWGTFGNYYASAEGSIGSFYVADDCIPSIAYPFEFVEAPSVNATYKGTSPNVNTFLCTGSSNGSRLSTPSYGALRFASSPFEASVYIHAIGKWK